MPPCHQDFRKGKNREIHLMPPCEPPAAKEQREVWKSDGSTQLSERPRCPGGAQLWLRSGDPASRPGGGPGGTGEEAAGSRCPSPAVLLISSLWKDMAFHYCLTEVVSHLIAPIKYN